ncbi:hypothetical protein T439DRAFT_333377 [Meredithblackwellia eburnea MCA 4105]
MSLSDILSIQLLGQSVLQRPSALPLALNGPRRLFPDVQRRSGYRRRVGNPPILFQKHLSTAYQKINMVLIPLGYQSSTMSPEAIGGGDEACDSTEDNVLFLMERVGNVEAKIHVLLQTSQFLQSDRILDFSKWDTLFNQLVLGRGGPDQPPPESDHIIHYKYFLERLWSTFDNLRDANSSSSPLVAEFEAKLRTMLKEGVRIVKQIDSELARIKIFLTLEAIGDKELQMMIQMLVDLLNQYERVARKLYSSQYQVCYDKHEDFIQAETKGRGLQDLSSLDKEERRIERDIDLIIHNFSAKQAQMPDNPITCDETKEWMGQLYNMPLPTDRCTLADNNAIVAGANAFYAKWIVSFTSGSFTVR